MATIPESVIEEVRRRAEIVEVVSHYLPLKKSGANYRALCPFHQEKSPSFNVNPAKQIFHCFGCGEGGNSITFVMKKEGVTFPEAVRILADRYGVDIPKEKRGGEGELDDVYRALESAAEFYHQRLLNEKPGAAVNQYLQKRGVDHAMVNKLRLGVAPDEWDSLTRSLIKQGFSTQILEKAGLARKSARNEFIDRFRARLIFPICSPGGRPLGFAGRTLGEDAAQGPKYLNSPETPVYQKSKILYGFHLAREAARREGFLFVVEGYMDALALYKAGVENCVACAGTALTPGHAELIKRVCDKVTALFDSDKAGVTAAKRSGPILLEHDLRVRVLALEGYKDPDEFLANRSAEDFLNLAAKAPTFHEYMINTAISDVDITDTESKFAVIREIIPHIRKIKDEIERAHYAQLLAERTGTDVKAVLKTAAKPAQEHGEAKPAGPKTGASASRQKPLAAHRAERVLLAALISNPSYLDTIAADLAPEEFSDPDLRKIFEAALDAKNRGAHTSADIIHYVEDEEVRRAITSLASDRGVIDEEEAENSARDCMGRMRRRGVDRRQELEKVKEAEKTGDTESAQKAQKKYFDIRKNGLS
ncbi:MAG: DNA primase [Nitrospinae bacterium]|nr:DNA primase [Nitrospinota bacterium]